MGWAKFIARDTRLDRKVAIKILPADFAKDAERLLNHPNILTVHDFGLHEGAPYLVPELLAGEDNDEQRWMILCFDKKSGKRLWERTLRTSKPGAARHEKATHANTTLSTDGKGKLRKVESLLMSTTRSANQRLCLTRRDFLAQASTGFGMLAFSALANAQQHFPAKVKNVIFCYMSGGVSHLDSFDPKPRLQKEAGQPMPVPIDRTMFNDNGTIMPSPWTFKNYGQCGMPVSELFPHIGELADDLCLIRSMTAKFMEHAQANNFFHSGNALTGYPSLGAWTTYGLGTENKNLPGYVVLGSGEIPLGGINVYGSGFLPAVHQGSFLFPERAEALQDIAPKQSDALQRRQLAFLAEADREFLTRTRQHNEVDAAIKNYETAYRMQSAVPELVDLNGETEATKKLYGLDSTNEYTRAYARQCLLARRLVERGVRFVELTMVAPKEIAGGNCWDQHGGLKKYHAVNAFTVDQPIAGLIRDLKARGLFDETLVLWAGEFGRTPFVQGKDGRDHNITAFSLWMAGGGVRGGTIFGATDEYGYRVAENPLEVCDLHATILHLLGIDHERLTFRYGGRDFRLTDVHGHVVKAILR